MEGVPRRLEETRQGERDWFEKAGIGFGRAFLDWRRHQSFRPKGEVSPCTNDAGPHVPPNVH